MKIWISLPLALCLATAACNKERDARGLNSSAPETNGLGLSEIAQSDMPAPCSLALAPHSGDGKIDRDIIFYQSKIKAGQNAFASIENLGWLYVAKARQSFDPGYYKLAEQCAYCLESKKPHSPEAMLLRGHVLQNLHKFKEAEPLARELVAIRGLSFDHGLLGDVLMEQGRLDEAANSYQKMVDLKPDLESYSRIAHYRWLKGDLAAATELMQSAVSAASPNAPESAAWVNTRLAFYQFQSGELSLANDTCDVALDYQTNYPPALLLRGRLLLAEGKADEAVQALTRAEKFNPLPDYQWTLSEALHAAGQEDAAALVETRLNNTGAGSDPRTFALYLASQGQTNATSLELAYAELNSRADVFTQDALAWALFANGQPESAYQVMQKALKEGTVDARLYFHATLIANRAGHNEEAAEWLEKTAPLIPQLLPSEQKLFQQMAVQLGLTDTAETGSQTTAFAVPQK